MPHSTLTWKGGRRFDAEVEGNRLTIDGSPERPGAGPTPVQLLLPALGACSGVDVAAILEKKRIPVESIEIAVDATRREDRFPRVFTAVDVLFTVRGGEIPAKAVADAIRLSRDHYCSVSAMLAGPELTWRYRIENPAGRVTAEGAVD